MKTKNMLTIFSFAGLLFFSCINAACALSADGWHITAAEYEKVHEAAKNEGKPFILFFYVDWCGYCKRFRESLLKDQKVENFLASCVKVMINPENGSAEGSLSMQYGVRGYPDFRVVFPDGSSSKIRPFKPGGEILSPEEFIAKLEAALVSTSSL